MNCRHISLCLGLVLVAMSSAVAQEVPRAEVYLGYSFVRVAPPEHVNAFNSNGGLGSFQYNFNKNLGVLAEFGGNTNGQISIGGVLVPCTGGGCTGATSSVRFPGDQTQFSYLFGPRFFMHKTSRISPFFNFLFGGIHNSRSFSVSNSLIPAGFVPPRGATFEPGSTSSKFRSTQNAFAMAVGGGIDVKLFSGLSVRPIELEYLPSHFSPFNVVLSNTAAPPNINNTRWQHNLRYSAGVTMHFGGH
jgi:opacity protein-like surface antigen